MSVLCPKPGGARRATFLTSATLRANENKRALHGVVRALQDGSQTPSPTLLEKEFSLADKVAMVTRANRGLGLEGALALAEAGARTVLNVNLKGVFNTAQAAGQQMERFGNGGSLILVASIAGHVTVNRGITPYEIAKSGVHQMARSLACELAPKSIHANTISPGYFQSPMLNQLFKERPGWGHILTNANPMRRVGEGRELRGAVVWLASDASSFCTGSEYIRPDVYEVPLWIGPARSFQMLVKVAHDETHIKCGAVQLLLHAKRASEWFSAA
ncbi:Sorbose reductase sou1 [Trametes pubescens]|uniref:Sorbose reductase sou1 n=1 Tax=Trametes pubescens TaxID=154538 RepID=A0A1M2V5A4_TRAPU|nr:Sorbose reductase sou1 [Trametes pubescens]